METSAKELKRKRSKSVSQAGVKRCRTTAPPPTSSVATTAAEVMDLEAILADLEDSSFQQQQEQQVEQQPQVHYYTTYAPQHPEPPQNPGYVTIAPPVVQQQQQQQQQRKRKLQIEPKLLMRQMYKLCNQADAVVGLESSSDFKASVYFVSSESSVHLTIEDLLSVRSVRVSTLLDSYFKNTTSFNPLYFNTVLIKPINAGAVTITNYQVRVRRQQGFSVNDVLCQTSSPLLLQASGWNALKRVFDCIENYFRICEQCSPTVQNLISSYCRYFTRHYKTSVLLAAASNSDGGLKVPQDIEHSIVKDLPIFLADFNEKRLPQEDSFQTSPLQAALLPFVDSEVRRFCSPIICEAVLQDLKYDVIRW